MTNEFEAVRGLPWSTGVWGLQLTHSDTDVGPECTVAFIGHRLRDVRAADTWWVEVEFEVAEFARAAPHHDVEDLREVTGYDIAVRAGDYDVDQAEWLRSGICPDPAFYFCTDSDWLDQTSPRRNSRSRSYPSPDDTVHFLLDGREGYVEVIASSFKWAAWSTGHPLLSDVDRPNPIADGRFQRRL